MRAAWWWIDRWRKSTAYSDMTAEEQGLYRNLLDEVWHRSDGIIPDDSWILGRVSGDPDAWKRSGAKVLTWMQRVEGGWTNETALEVQRQSLRRSENQRNYRQRLKLQLVHRRTADNGADNAAGNGRYNNPDSPSPSPSLKDLGNQQDLVTVRQSGIPNRTRAQHARVARPTKPADPHVKEFLEWFPLEYKTRRHGADYLVKWPRDAPLVKHMLQATSLKRLKMLAQVMLSDTCAEDFIINTDRGIGILSVKFNWLSDRLAEWESKQRAQTKSS
jgi:uncharacterized protein YdaU (DUF1376 family)